MSESTPFLADIENGNGEEVEIAPPEESIEPRPTANSLFARHLQIITYILSILSILGFLILQGTNIFIRTGPFESWWRSANATENLAIVLLINTIVTIPTLFIKLPILIPGIINPVMAFFILGYSLMTFDGGWPGRYFCRNGHYLPTKECLKAENLVEVLMGLGGGIGITIGLLLIATFVIRVIAIGKTKPWAGLRAAGIGSFQNATGLTVQLSLSVLPSGTLPTVVQEQNEGTNTAVSQAQEEERLIEA